MVGDGSRKNDGRAFTVNGSYGRVRPRFSRRRQFTRIIFAVDSLVVCTGFDIERIAAPHAGKAESDGRGTIRRAGIGGAIGAMRLAGVGLRLVDPVGGRLCPRGPDNDYRDKPE
jgi:hypothetical protein